MSIQTTTLSNGLRVVTHNMPHLETASLGMWVATVARGTDVATLLVDAALAEAPACGWTRVLLDVAHENGRARSFYARMGFRSTGRVDTMPWDASVTEETLALDLPAVT